MSQNINQNLPLARACRDDVAKYCADATPSNASSPTSPTDAEGAAIVACLKKIRTPAAAPWLTARVASMLSWLANAASAAATAAAGTGATDIAKSANATAAAASATASAAAAAAKTPVASKAKPELSAECDAQVFRAQLDSARCVGGGVKRARGWRAGGAWTHMCARGQR